MQARLAAADESAMRALVCTALTLLLTSCGNSPAKPATAKAEIPALAAPILAPMQARDRLLHDLDVQKLKARGRADTLDDVIGRR